ncbi:MAG TPA: ATP-binding protein, partial [Pseudomonadota bacterium]|nr:ATP-binding protein [Pseudomonadota bacterium]
MRIDSLKLQNFKRFREQTFELHPRFTLLVGENGAGKTSVLDALAVALGIWLVEVPESSLVNSRRNIM